MRLSDNTRYKYLLVIFMCASIDAQYQTGSGFAGLPFDLSRLSKAERKDAFNDLATDIFQLVRKYFIKKNGQVVYATDNNDRNGIAEGLFNLVFKMIQIDDLDNFQSLAILSREFSDENNFKKRMLRFKKDKNLKKFLFYTWMYEFMTNPEFHAFYTAEREQLINSEILKTERILNFIEDDMDAPTAFKTTLHKRIAYLNKKLSDMESKTKQDSEHTEISKPDDTVAQKPKKTVRFDDEPKIVEFDSSEPIIQTEPVEVIADLAPVEKISTPVAVEKIVSQPEEQSLVPATIEGRFFAHLTDDQLKDYVVHNRLKTGEQFQEAARRLGGAEGIRTIRQNYLTQKK